MEIAALGSGSLKLSAVPVKLEDQEEASPTCFIHTTIFVVVDRHARNYAAFLRPAATASDWTNDVQPKNCSRPFVSLNANHAGIHDLRTTVNAASLNGLRRRFFLRSVLFSSNVEIKIAHLNCMISAFVTSIIFFCAAISLITAISPSFCIKGRRDF